MNNEIEILEFIYENTKVCQETILRIIKIRNKNDELEGHIKKQYLEYKKISNSSKNMLERRKKKVNDEVNIVGKIVTYMQIKKNIQKDDSKEQIANILIEGSKIGIEQIKNKISEIKIKSKPILNLINKLINLENYNIQEMKKICKQKQE